jgi:hypothetical protein
MADDKDDKWDVPIEIVRKGGLRDWPPSVPPPPGPTRSQIEAFESKCYWCFWRSWDVFESGAPMWSTCKHPGHQQWHTRDGGGWTPEYKNVDCVTVAEHYDGKKCPKFWPIILRMPFRLAWRGSLSALRWYFERKYRKEQEKA